LAAAVAAARCGGLQLDAATRRVALPAAARLDLRHFELGFAVDRAAEVLREHGASTFFLRLGAVRRGVGPGPQGRGWRVLLPVFRGFRRSMGEFFLRDQALAIARADDGFLAAGGSGYPPYINLTTGDPRTGVQAVLAVTELALDAQGLAASLFILESQRGQYRLGQLKPRPSVRWLLGSGTGPPLITDYNWTALELR
jgi:thiamine biosynthesis lipoprotein ApbE